MRITLTCALVGTLTAISTASLADRGDKKDEDEATIKTWLANGGKKSWTAVSRTAVLKCPEIWTFYKDGEFKKQILCDGEDPEEETARWEYEARVRHLYQLRIDKATWLADPGHENGREVTIMNRRADSTEVKLVHEE